MAQFQSSIYMSSSQSMILGKKPCHMNNVLYLCALNQTRTGLHPRADRDLPLSQSRQLSSPKTDAAPAERIRRRRVSALVFSLGTAPVPPSSVSVRISAATTDQQANSAAGGFDLQLHQSGRVAGKFGRPRRRDAMLRTTRLLPLEAYLMTLPGPRSR